MIEFMRRNDAFFVLSIDQLDCFRRVVFRGTSIWSARRKINVWLDKTLRNVMYLLPVDCILHL